MKATEMKHVAFRMPPREHLELQKFLLGKMSSQKFFITATRREWNRMLIAEGRKPRFNDSELEA